MIAKAFLFTWLFTLLTVIPTGPPLLRAHVKMVSIFDGKTLKGWSGDPKNWSVKDGSIDGSSLKTSGTYLSSDRDYSSFRLIFKERKVAGNNHLGIGFWGSRNSPGDYGPNKCILVITPPGAMWDYGTNGVLEGAMITKKFVDPDAPFNFQWHHIEIVADRSTGEVRAAVNGIQVTGYTDRNPSRFKAGPVRLQLHGFAENQEMQYKDISVEAAPNNMELITVPTIQ